MLKIFRTLIGLIGIVIFSYTLTFAETPSIDNFNDLVERGRTLDNKEFIVKGEAIGEALKRKENTWINISDGNASIGLFMSNELANKIKTFGNYDYTGDMVEVKAVFNVACTEHGGEMDFHVKELKVIEHGHKVNHSISKNKIILFSALCSISLILIGIFFYKKINVS